MPRDELTKRYEQSTSHSSAYYVRPRDVETLQAEIAKSLALRDRLAKIGKSRGFRKEGKFSPLR